MIPLAVLLPVFATHLAAAFSPGPAVLMNMRLAASRGMRTASGFALGVAIGAMVWAAAALLGLSVLFQIVPWLFVAMKIVGALFLIYVGFMTFRHAASPVEVGPGTAEMPFAHAARFGLILQLTNPKPAVFFSAVFVTLVPPDTPPSGLAIILLIVGANELGASLIIARIFSLPRARMGYTHVKTRVERVFGTLLAGFGLKLALS